jgi:hypothetical protein
MDNIYIIVIAIGAGIMLFSLVLKKETVNPPSVQRKQVDRYQAEIEKALQQINRQAAERQARIAREAEETRLALMQEMASLRRRLEELENAQNGMQRSPSQDRPEHVEEEEPDLLALRERYQRVFELSREGLTPDEIAKRLGAGRGEIDLIFLLAAKREGSQGHV